MVARCCPPDLAASGGGTDKPAASRVRPHRLFQRDLGIDLFCVTDTPVPCVNKVAEDDDVRITVSGPDAAGHAAAERMSVIIHGPREAEIGWRGRHGRGRALA